MQRQATSKKRVAEAEKEIDMEDKEATLVEAVSYTHLDVYKRQIIQCVRQLSGCRNRKRVQHWDATS